ncbi:MAG: SMC-Scp complex subunit ScpB [Elusimicrobiaceae bacterium]|nr:SMC-Scp complex subunit ScpB [Elusimicrobiaceae bacterium]
MFSDQDEEKEAALEQDSARADEAAVQAEPAAEAAAPDAEPAAGQAEAAVDAIESITEAELRRIIETVLFITDKPVPLGKICSVAEVNNADFALGVIKKIQKEYLESGSSVQIIEVGGGYQMSTKPEFGRWVRRLYGERMSAKLSAAALETLAIAAYRQPITRAEMEAVRGVDVIGPLETLIERGIVKVVGRKETIGRPLLYGTTAEFLRLFGLAGLKDLPTLESFGIDTSALDENRQPELFELPENTVEGLNAELTRAVAENSVPADENLTELEIAARSAGEMGQAGAEDPPAGSAAGPGEEQAAGGVSSGESGGETDSAGRPDDGGRRHCADEQE